MDKTDTRDLPSQHTFGYLSPKTVSEDKLSCRISLPVKARCTGFQEIHSPGAFLQSQTT